MRIEAYSTVVTPGQLTIPFELVQHLQLAEPSFRQKCTSLLQYLEDHRALVSHLARSRHYFKLEFEAQYLDDFTLWAIKNNCILISEDQSVRDPRGKVIFNVTKQRLEGGKVPYLMDAYLRRAENLKKLSRLKLPFDAELAPVLSQAELILPSAKLVAQRALALFATGIAALNGRAYAEKLVPFIFQQTDWFSAKEREFLKTGQQSEQFAWRLEACFALIWALDLTPNIDHGNQEVDLDWLISLVKQQDEDAIIQHASLRPDDEILNMLDWYYRLHWAAVELRITKQQSNKIIEDIVLERHLALNWLTNFDNAQLDQTNHEWDQTLTPC